MPKKLSVDLDQRIAAEIDIQVSLEGEEIRRYVRQPRQLRAPVSYKPSFLEQYTPNSSAYLPEPVRTQRHDLGRPAPRGQQRRRRAPLPVTSSTA